MPRKKKDSSKKDFIVYKEMQSHDSFRHFMVNQKAHKIMNKKYPPKKYRRYYDVDSKQIRIEKR